MVIRRIAEGHWRPSITLGNQKWKGAAPDFSKRATTIKNWAELVVVKLKEAARIITEEPRAWIKKYLRAASEEYWFLFVEIRGIKDKRLSSKPIQAPNQEVEEAANPVPSKRVEKNKMWVEDIVIKKRGVWPS